MPHQSDEQVGVRVVKAAPCCLLILETGGFVKLNLSAKGIAPGSAAMTGKVQTKKAVFCYSIPFIISTLHCCTYPWFSHNDKVRRWMEIHIFEGWV